MVMVYATGHLSGAHFNPAVTIAFTMARHFPRRDAALHRGTADRARPWSAVLLAVWTDTPADLGATVPTVGVGSALLYEIVLTAFLMFVIMAVATDTRAVGRGGRDRDRWHRRTRRAVRRTDHRRVDEPRALVRAGARLGEWTDFWVYVVGPLAGAALGVLRLPVGPRRAAARGGLGDGEVLFVCLHNAGRSQMSEALFDSRRGRRHEAALGRDEADASGSIPEVVEVMRELDIDLSGRTPRRLTRADAEWADVVVTMGCGDECPYIPGKRYLDWELDDPDGRPVDEVRATRDEIQRRVADLAGLGSTARGSERYPTSAGPMALCTTPAACAASTLPVDDSAALRRGRRSPRTCSTWLGMPPSCS